LGQGWDMRQEEWSVVGGQWSEKIEIKRFFKSAKRG
jgi:hypothetical protein